jgi:hypothetical protein
MIKELLHKGKFNMIFMAFDGFPFTAHAAGLVFVMNIITLEFRRAIIMLHSNTLSSPRQITAATCLQRSLSFLPSFGVEFFIRPLTPH